MKVYDVVIAGAGPAGSALAIELAGQGYSVLLADAARFPRDKPCGDYVSPKGLARLEALGCGQAIRALECQPIRSSRLYLNKTLLVEGTLPSRLGFPAYGHAIPRRELDNVLFQRALSSGAEAMESTRIRGFEAGRSGVEICGDRDGKETRARGRLLVGADGASSAVAEVAGRRTNDPRYTLASMRAYVHGLELDRTIMYFDEQYFPGYGWIFPVRPGLCNIGVGMVKESLVRGGLRLPDFYAKFQRFVRRLADSRGARIEVGPHRGWPIRTYGGAAKNYFERGLLIGEAGSFVDPINGEGIPLAFETAGIAARTIRAAFEEGRFEAQFLARYEKEWREKLDVDLGISDLVVSLIRNRRFLPVWLTLFRTMSLTARSDEKYARVTGGILGGVIPAREGITPEMFLRALVHGPDFWRRALGLDRLKSWTDLTGLARGAFEDGPSLLPWLQEIERKQRAVAVRALRR